MLPLRRIMLEVDYRHSRVYNFAYLYLCMSSASWTLGQVVGAIVKDLQ